MIYFFIFVEVDLSQILKRKIFTVIYNMHHLIHQSTVFIETQAIQHRTFLEQGMMQCVV